MRVTLPVSPTATPSGTGSTAPTGAPAPAGGTNGNRSLWNNKTLIILSFVFLAFMIIGFLVSKPWSFISWAIALPFLVFSAISLVRSYRRAQHEERQGLTLDEQASAYVRPSWYWPSTILLVWMPFLVLHAAVGIWVMNHWGVDQTAGPGNTPWNWGLLVLSLQVLHLIMSTRIIMPSQVGVRRFLGMQLHVLRNGPHLAPFPFFWIRLFPVDVQEDELPGDPEVVFDGEANEPVPEGKVRPIRVVFSDSISAETKDRLLAFDPGFLFTDSEDGLDPYETRVAIPIQIGLRWKIRNPMQFAEEIRTMRSARKQLLDIVTGWVNQELVNMRVRDVQGNIQRLNSMLQREIEIAIGVLPAAPVPPEIVGRRKPGWGIDVIQIWIKGITPSHSLAKSMQLAAQERGAARALDIKGAAQARFEERTRAGVGKGDKAAIIAVGEGRNAAFRLLTGAKKDGGAGIAAKTLYAGTIAESVAKEVDTLVAVGPEGMTSLAGSVAAAAAILAKKPTPTPPAPPAGGAPTPTPPGGGTPPTPAPPAGGGHPPRASGGGGGGVRRRRGGRGSRGGTP